MTFKKNRNFLSKYSFFMENFLLKTSTRYASFLKEASARAKMLFSYIDKNAQPEVFLTAVKLGENLKESQIEVLSLSDSWTATIDFSAFEKTLLKVSEKSNANSKISYELKSIRQALIKMVNTSPQKPSNINIFFSEANDINGIQLFVGFSIDKELLEKYPSLDLPEETSDEISLSTSFMDSLITEFLEKHRIELDLPANLTEITGFHFGLDSIVRQAGRNFVGDIAYRVSGKKQALWRDHIFSICTEISRTHYELEEAFGSIILAPKECENLQHSIEFSATPKIAQTRSTRKLLELTKKDNMALHCDGETVLGLCKLPRKIKGTNCFLIEFLGRHKWQISHAGKVLVVISYGVPMPPKTSFEAQEYSDALKKVFGFKTTRKVEKLVELIQTAAKEKKGTLLVISKKAKDEAKRLALQSTPIAPTPLNKQLLSYLTPIDGAILIDPNCVCHSIGTILDGTVSKSGDSGRGARYNSALKYIEFRREKGELCMAIVISEDGNVDII